MAAVRAALRLEGGLDPYQIRTEATEHILDHMIGPDAKHLVSNVSWQVSIAQMPRQAHELPGILMPDFDNGLRGGLHLEPPPILELYAIAIGHGHRFGKVEQDIFALIRRQANAAAMACVKIEREGACRLFLGPMSSAAMHRCVIHRRLST